MKNLRKIQFNSLHLSFFTKYIYIVQVKTLQQNHRTQEKFILYAKITVNSQPFNKKPAKAKVNKKKKKKVLDSVTNLVPRAFSLRDVVCIHK